MDFHLIITKLNQLKMRRKSSFLFPLVLLLLQQFSCFAVVVDTPKLSEQGFIAIVQKYHPVVLQANIDVALSKSAVRQSRGAFDPTINWSSEQKTFDGKKYFNYDDVQLNIPTWYGLQFSVGATDNAGYYMNPEVTPGRLNYVGVKLSPNDIIMDKRRAALRQAQSMMNLSFAERQLVINDLIFDALSVYYEWVKEYQIYSFLNQVVENNKQRFSFIKSEYLLGNRPAIDTIEALAQWQSFQQQQLQAWMSFQNAGWQLANYLWLENKVSFDWHSSITPEISDFSITQNAIGLVEQIKNYDWKLHPKMKMIDAKTEYVQIEKRLKQQSLYPKINLKANTLSRQFSEELFAPNLDRYKLDFGVSMPLFLREARGAYKMAQLKLNSLKIDQQQTEWQLKTKSNNYQQQFENLNQQIQVFNQVFSNYQQLFQGEKMKFEVGESTVFLLNAREMKLLEVQQKMVDLNAKARKSQAGLIWSVAGFTSEIK